MRRHEQIGGGAQFFYAAHGTWVEIRPPEWNLLVREIFADPDGFLARHPRLLVAFHKQTATQFAPLTVAHYDQRSGALHRRDPGFRMWEDIAALRTLYTSRGCAFSLATLLREPSDLYLSDYLFEGEVTGRPFADFMGRDIQS